MSSFLNAGIIALTLGYTLSQFYRAFLAVLSQTLQTELGATPGDLALSSGMWFLTFALMQLPVGWALGLSDWFGAPRGPAGLWQGLVLGLTCAAILLSVRLARSARRRIHSA